MVISRSMIPAKSSSSSSRRTTDRSSQGVMASTSRKVSYPCGNCDCSKRVQNEEDAILCDSCKSWVHFDCSNLSESDFKFLGSTSSKNILWHCDSCLGKPTDNLSLQIKQIEGKVNQKLHSLRLSIGDELKELKESFINKMENQKEALKKKVDTIGESFSTVVSKGIKKNINNNEPKNLREMSQSQ